MLEITHLLGRNKKKKKPQQTPPNTKGTEAILPKAWVKHLTPPKTQTKLAENEINNILAHMHGNPHIVCSLSVQMTFLAISCLSKQERDSYVYVSFSLLNKS